MSEPSKPTLSERYWGLPWAARIGLVLVVGVAVVLAVNALGRPGASSRSAPAASPAPAVPAGQIGDGVWLVGSDVAPGTYRSTGPAEAGGYCMWSRHDTASGGPMDGIIASDGSYDASQMLVTVEVSDVVFRTSGCAPFQRVG